jgi:hypothetical protein
LQEPQLTVKQRKYIKIIEKSGKQNAKYYQWHIINISKVESGQIEVLKTETDINDVLQYTSILYKWNKTRIQLSLKKKLHANENLLKPIKKNYMLH